MENLFFSIRGEPLIEKNPIPTSPQMRVSSYLTIDPFGNPIFLYELTKQYFYFICCYLTSSLIFLQNIIKKNAPIQKLKKQLVKSQQT